ncbi:flagellar biosynthetic protein FliO [Nitrosomonas sp. Nm166]|uniref:flagellar biosynthetic protein FliO n=1 Tax=Nitrosomonas sp. Nm166 TaxID=1881054 RepID=UPI00210C4A1F|nr:flagellar biosynthetic protein FliO [Nitrosomonas sp. Nm166]
MSPFHALAETGKLSYTPPPSIISTESTLQTMGGLLLVLAIIGGITWLLKRFALIPTPVTGVLKIIAATGVGQRERIVVVEIDNTWLILGVAPGRVDKLHTMDKPNLNTTDKTQTSTSTEAFAVQLNESIKKNDV